MTILHVIASFDPVMGGVSQAVRTMIKGLEKCKVKNHILCLDDPSAKYLQSEAIMVYAKGPGKGPWCYNRNFLHWLEQNALNYDVILVHGLWLYNTYATYQALRKKLKTKTSQSRVFVMPHGMLSLYFQKAKGRKLKAVRNWIFWKLIERKLIKEADGILFTTQEEYNNAQKTFIPYNPKKELITNLGVENPPEIDDRMQKAFYKKCPQIQGKSFFLFLGRIHEVKGIDLLIDAYQTLLEDKQNQKFNIPCLVIAGPGVDNYYGTKLHKKVINSPELKDKVMFTGMLDGDSKWGAIYSCETLVLPSHHENFGVVVVEALACSKPVLTSKKVNIWNEIYDSGGGLFEDDTLDGTIKLLRDWMQLDEGKKIEMGRRAFETYQKYYTVQRSAKKLVKLLKS